MAAAHLNVLRLAVGTVYSFLRGDGTRTSGKLVMNKPLIDVLKGTVGASLSFENVKGEKDPKTIVTISCKDYRECASYDFQEVNASEGGGRRRRTHKRIHKRRKIHRRRKHTRRH